VMCAATKAVLDEATSVASSHRTAIAVSSC
jgi:hypothetical protein